MSPERGDRNPHVRQNSPLALTVKHDDRSAKRLFFLQAWLRALINGGPGEVHVGSLTVTPVPDAL
jgi:hypothetical protein